MKKNITIADKIGALNALIASQKTKIETTKGRIAKSKTEGAYTGLLKIQEDKLVELEAELESLAPKTVEKEERTCKGSLALGTACGHCSKCKEELAQQEKKKKKEKQKKKKKAKADKKQKSEKTKPKKEEKKKTSKKNKVKKKDKKQDKEKKKKKQKKGKNKPKGNCRGNC
ncbi:MAG: hypothetical protein U9Q66_02035 [Patescibacteria group bacterium]|nr:hypothetical protein [Patescibacteria group bacterium]